LRRLYRPFADCWPAGRQPPDAPEDRRPRPVRRQGRDRRRGEGPAFAAGGDLDGFTLRAPAADAPARPGDAEAIMVRRRVEGDLQHPPAWALGPAARTFGAFQRRQVEADIE